MLCQRCRGLLVLETFEDLREETGRMCRATRCVNCGYVEDSVVRANRLHPPTGKRSGPHRMARKDGVVFLKTLSGRFGSI